MSATLCCTSMCLHSQHSQQHSQQHFSRFSACLKLSCRHVALQLAMPQPSFSRATAIQSLRTHESIESLRSNLREEHMLKMDWVSRGLSARSQLLVLVRNDKCVSCRCCCISQHGTAMLPEVLTASLLGVPTQVMTLLKHTLTPVQVARLLVQVRLLTHADELGHCSK